MKKYFLVVLCAVLVFVVAGCSKKNQLVCTGESTESGVKMKAEIVADFDSNDKLTDATVTYDLGSKEVADQYCSLFKLAEDKEKGVTIDCSGSKIIMKGYANVSDEDEEAVVGKTKEEFKKLVESDQGVTCK